MAIRFLEASEKEIDRSAERLQLDTVPSVLINSSNVISFFKDSSISVAEGTTMVVPGYLVKAGIPTCNTEVAKLITYLAASHRRRGLNFTFIAPSVKYLDGRIRRLLGYKE